MTSTAVLEKPAPIAAPAPRVGPTRRRGRGIHRRGPVATVLLVLGIVFFVGFTLYPLVFMVSGSFKSLAEDYSGFASLFPKNPTIENYVHVLAQNSLNQTNLFLNVRNSLVIALLTIAISMIIALPAGYVIARRSGPLATAVSGWVRIAQVVGGIIVIIPLYVILHSLGLVNTMLGVSIAEAIPCSAFATWILISFVRQVPIEVEEAARIDGAGALATLWHVVLPLVRPGLFSTILVVFLLSWNDFLNPLILISNPNYYTVTVALFTFIGQPGQIDWGTLLTFGTLACLPAILVIAFAERQLVRGLVAGAGK